MKSRALKETRNNLSKNIKNIVDTHIEAVDPKYKEERILFREETEKNYNEKTILIRRNSLRKSNQNLSEEIQVALENQK